MLEFSADATSAEALAIVDRAPFRVEQFAKDAVIFLEGDQAPALYRVITGCVRLQVNGEDGERHIVSFLFPGELFGFSNEAQHLSAEAVAPVRLARYDMASLLRLNGHLPRFILSLMGTADRRLAEFAHHSLAISHLAAPERLLWFFHWLAGRLGRAPGSPATIDLPMTWREAADFLSLKRETLSRVLRELSDRGHVVREARRRIRLLRRQSGIGLTASDGTAPPA